MLKDQTFKTGAEIAQEIEKAQKEALLKRDNSINKAQLSLSHENRTIQ